VEVSDAARRPAPMVTDDSAVFWDAAAGGRLVAQRCAACGRLRHPPRPMCPDCHSLDVEVAELSGHGTVYSFAILHHPQNPAFDYPVLAVLVDLDEGVRVVSNLTGVDATGDLFRLVADHDAALIICYVQGANVREVGDFDFGADPVALMRDYFARQIETATRQGVSRIFIDPGLGFYYRNLSDSAMRVRHQMKVFLNTFRLRTLGFPVCHALPHAFEFFREEVRCAEPFFAVLAALGKTDLFRTHEVPRTRAVLDALHVF